MELKVAPAFLCASLGLVALFLVYISLTCNSVYRGDPWIAEASVTINTEDSSSSPSEIVRETAPEKSIAQFLREKIERGILLRFEDEESDELAGLDSSTRALLVELLRSLRRRSGVADPNRHEKRTEMLNLDYGVKRVVKRLVVCSAYRTSLREFTVITLSPDFTLPTSNPDYRSLPPKDPAVKRSCTWLPDSGAEAPLFGYASDVNETGRTVVSNGEAKFQWVGESHGKSYDVMLVHCTFPEPVGMDDGGGFLYLNITHSDLGESSSPSELAPVHHEKPGSLNMLMYEEASPKFRYQFAYCSGPVFSILTPSRMKEFLMYHYALLQGDVHFFIYDSGSIDPDTMAVLQPLIDAGVLTVVDFGRESEYDTWYHGQDLAINDCLYRGRDLARWVLSWDLDEYLHVVAPLTFPAILAQHEDAPWISFGKIEFSPRHCAAENASAEWAVERMLYRDQKPICGSSCNGDKGARKWMANPRKVTAGRIHAVVDPVNGGVVLPADVARMNHYRGLPAARGRFICEEIHDSLETIVAKGTDGKRPLECDSELASLVRDELKGSVEALPIFGGHATS